MKKKDDNRIVSHIISLVLGIISILTSLFWYIALPTGIIALILGINTYKNYGTRVGLAGMVTGIIGLSLMLLIYISLIIIIIISKGY